MCCGQQYTGMVQDEYMKQSQRYIMDGARKISYVLCSCHIDM